MDNKNKAFSYTYSARQQEEINRIRQKYQPPQENKMEQLRKLDQSVENPSMIIALSTGILGTLLLGAGMSGVMVGSAAMFIPGIIVGVIGMAIIGAAYPLYLRTLKKNREKHAPEILKLLNELSPSERAGALQKSASSVNEDDQAGQK